MSTSVEIADDLVAEASRQGQVNHRSLPKQIEYWSRIGKVVEENPDLPYSLIKEILSAREETVLEAYQFG
ncbi:MAG: hypothetical protein HQL93_14005 [Magnetococcales bacterium]|nr:hypothetical protein [Magnetococcales bacterium]